MARTTDAFQVHKFLLRSLFTREILNELLWSLVNMAWRVLRSCNDETAFGYQG